MSRRTEWAVAHESGVQILRFGAEIGDERVDGEFAVAINTEGQTLIIEDTRQELTRLLVRALHQLQEAK